MISKVMRDKSKAIAHTKESLLRDMHKVDSDGLSIEELMDEFVKLRFKHMRIFGTDMDPELVKPKMLRCAARLGDDYAEKISEWRMDGNHLKWDYDKLKLQLLYIEDEQSVKEREAAAAGGNSARQGAAQGRPTKKGQDARGKMDCFGGADCSRAKCPYKHPPGREEPTDNGGKKGKGQGQGGRGGGNKECYLFGDKGHQVRNCPLKPSKEEIEAKKARANLANVPAGGAAQPAQAAGAGEPEGGQDQAARQNAARAMAARVLSFAEKIELLRECRAEQQMPDEYDDITARGLSARAQFDPPSSEEQALPWEDARRASYAEYLRKLQVLREVKDSLESGPNAEERTRIITSMLETLQGQGQQLESKGDGEAVQPGEAAQKAAIEEQAAQMVSKRRKGNCGNAITGFFE